MNMLPRTLCALLFLVLALLPASARPDRSFLVSPAQSREIRNFIRLLEEAHYNREAVRPTAYPEVIKNFMHDWDGQRLFFLASDAEAFGTRYGEGLYWNISSLGNIDPAFAIFQRYEERAQSRAQWVFNRLQGEFDLTSAETYLLDRSEVDWPADEAAADALWERRLHFEIVQELLNDKDLAEAKERIRKRYERMLKNLADIDTPEITEVFLTNVSQLYDPHSTYFSADTYADFSIQMRLQLVGIGALLGLEEDECVIKEVIAGGPADLDRRLKPNDKIIAVAQDGGEPVELIGMKLRRIVDLIRGERGTPVRLIVQPADAPDSSARQEIVLNRDVVNLDSARARGAIFQVPNEHGATSPIGVISLPAFYGPDAGSTDGDQNSATADVAKLIGRMQAQGIDGLVLDLRDNGGGLLSEAIDLTGLFIETGPVVQVRSYYGDVKVDNDENADVRYAGPLAVLVSKFSASASEIVAGALQNYGRAVVLGDSSTHGKGTVQTVYELGNLDPRLRMSGDKSGAAKFTIQKFYLPSGSSTQLNGVVPDIVLPSVEDLLKSGERELPQALVWDEIQSTQFDGSPLDPHLLTPLREASLARQETLDEFQYLRKNIDWFSVRQEQKDVSLNLEERIAQRDADKAFREAMDAERKRLRESNYAFSEFLLSPPKEKAAPLPLAAEGDASLETDLDGEPTDEPKEPEPEGYARLDIHLREALRVLSDAVELGRSPHYAGRAPLTAHSGTGG